MSLSIGIQDPIGTNILNKIHVCGSGSVEFPLLKVSAVVATCVDVAVPVGIQDVARSTVRQNFSKNQATPGVVVRRITFGILIVGYVPETSVATITNQFEHFKVDRLEIGIKQRQVTFNEVVIQCCRIVLEAAKRGGRRRAGGDQQSGGKEEA